MHQLVTAAPDPTVGVAVVLSSAAVGAICAVVVYLIRRRP